MRRCLVFLLILLLVPLCGCWDAQEINNQIFAINLALDEGEAQAFRLTLQFPMITPSGAGGYTESQQSKPQGDQAELMQNGYVLSQSEGDSMSECLNNMRASLTRELSLLQVKGIYLSETVARQDKLFDVFTALLQPRQLRPSASVIVCRGRAEDVLKKQTPLFGNRLSKAQTSQYGTLTEMSVIPEAPLNQFYNLLTNPSCSPVCILAAINNMQYVKQAEHTGGQPNAYLAGEIPRNGVNEVDYMGSAVFGGQKLCMLLNGYETQLLNLVWGKFKSGMFTVPDAASAVNVDVRAASPEIKVDLSGEQPLIQVVLHLEGSTYKGTLIQDPPLVQARLASMLEGDITDLLLRCQAQGLDPFCFNGYARRNVLTNQQWEAAGWPEQYAKAWFTVKVHFVLRENASAMSQIN